MTSCSGTQTRWRDGVLSIDKDELLALVMEDPYIGWADIDVARPGDSTRIVQIRDIIEPKVKVSGPGVTYPGISGRDVTTVGQGRTHRLGGMTLIACSEMPGFNPDGAHWWGYHLRRGPQRHYLCRHVGTGRRSPFCQHHQPLPADGAAPGSLRRRLEPGEQCRLAAGQRPPGGDDAKPGAARDHHVRSRQARQRPCPNIVFVPALASAEYRFGPRTSLGTNVYGIGRLTEPWLLQPTEMIDGAVFGTYMEHFHLAYRGNDRAPPVLAAWPWTSILSVASLVRSNWEAQAEKTAHGKPGGADGLGPGRQRRHCNHQSARPGALSKRFSRLQALERAGVDTVLMTEEEDNENGNAPPLLMSVPEIVSAVSTGTGGVEVTFPEVERVVGLRQPDPKWYEEKPPIHGRLRRHPFCTTFTASANRGAWIFDGPSTRLCPR